MKFEVDDKNRCRLVYVKFHLNRCRFAVAVAKCLGAHFFGDTVYLGHWACDGPGATQRSSVAGTVSDQDERHQSRRHGEEDVTQSPAVPGQRG